MKIYDLRFTIYALAVCLLPSACCLLPALAQPVPPSTAFTRYLLTSTNQAQFQERAGVTGGEATNVAAGVVINPADASQLTNANASALASGTIPAARIGDGSITTNKVDANFHELLMAGGGISLADATNAATTVATQATNTLAAPALIGTLPDATFPATLPQRNGVNLTNLNIAANLSAGTNTFVSTNYLGSGLSLTNLDVSAEWSANRMPLPPLSWGTWYDFENLVDITNVTEEYVRGQADWWSTNGMFEAGWKYINLIEGWHDAIDPVTGAITISSRFPSGLTNLASYIRSKGFTPGIYTSSGRNNSLTCFSYTGTDYRFINLHAQYFANWGFDFVFVDNCSAYESGDQDMRYLERVRLWNNAILKTRRNMALIVVPPQTIYSATDQGHVQQNIPSFHRLDVGLPSETYAWDGVPTANVYVIADYHGTNWTQYCQARTRKGQYFYQPYVQRTMTAPVQKLMFSLGVMGPWAITAQSTHARRDPAQTYEWWEDYYNPGNYDPYLGMMTNREVFAVHQDAAIIPGELVSQSDGYQLWTRKLGGVASGTNAILLVNYRSTNATLTVDLTQIGYSADDVVTFRELWSGTDYDAGYKGSFSISVTSSNVVLLKASKVQAPNTGTYTGGALAVGWPTVPHYADVSGNLSVSGFTGIRSNQTMSASLRVWNDSGGNLLANLPDGIYSTHGASVTLTNNMLTQLDFAVVQNQATNCAVTYFSYSVPFSPSDISGMVAWYRSEDLAGLSNGDPITSWTDASGNGWAATNAGSPRPIKITGPNSLPAAAFGGTHNLVHYIGNNTTPTIFAVVQMTNTMTGYRGIFQMGDANASGSMMLANHSTALKWGVYTTAEQAASTQLTAANTPMLLTMVDNAASGGTFYTNGVANGTWTGDSIGSSEKRIGGSAAQLLQGYISEIIVYDSNLSTPNREAVEAYLMGKYGL